MIEISKITTKEVRQTFKKAAELKDLGELNLSKNIMHYGKKYRPDELILIGRITAYRLKWGIETVNGPEEWRNTNAWKIDLAEALDKAGYIRNELSPIDISISRFYNSLFSLNIAPIINWSFDVKSNRDYERLVHVDEAQHEAIKDLLKEVLSPEEFERVNNDFGVESGGKLYSYFIKDVDWLKVEDLRERMPRLYSVNSKKHDDEVMNLIEKIDEIHKDPIFRKEMALRKKLTSYTDLPFTCADKARQKLLEYDLSSISKLGMDRHIYMYLARSGCTTISDLVLMSPERIKLIRGLNDDDKAEIDRIRKKLISPSSS